MTDFERIQGDWRLVSGERGANAFPDDIVASVRLSFRDNQLTTAVKDRATTFRFELHSEQSPSAIDLDMNGTIGMGIYKLDGDGLTIVHSEAGQPRPTKFATEAGTPLTMMVCRRAT